MLHGDHVTLPLKYFSTGSAVLDRILGGGLPEHSVTVIAGEPGAGKTVFTLQMLFHLARQGYKSLYFTTLSEPALKLIRYMQLFSFFDLPLLDDRCHFLDLGSTLRTEGVEPGLAVIREVVEREEPTLVRLTVLRPSTTCWVHRRRRGVSCMIWLCTWRPGEPPPSW